MVSLSLPLNGDVETHGSPSPAGTAWEKIDEEPHDSDTTRIRILNAMEVEASSVDASLLPVAIAVSAVRIRWAAAGTSSDVSFGQSGLRINGTDYWATPTPDSPQGEELSPHVYGGVVEDTWATNPENGFPWSQSAVAALIPIWQTTYQPSELGYPRLTMRTLWVDFEYSAPTPEGTGEAPVPRAVGSADLATLTGTVTTPSPTATAAAPAMSADVSISGPHSGDE